MDEYELSAKITADATNFENGVKKAQNSVNNLGNKFKDLTSNISSGAKNWGLDLDKFYNKGSSMFKNFGVDIDKFASHFGVSGKVIAGISAVTIAFEKMGEEFQKTRAIIAKGTGAIGSDLDNLQDNFRNVLGKGLSQNMMNVSSLFSDLNTRFDVTGKELENLTEQFSKFSTVTDTDVKTSVNGVADIIAKWNLSVEQSVPLMNQLTKASQMSGASVSQLMSNLSSGQVVLSQFGFTVDESISFLASLSKEGINSEQALMAMRTALAKWSNEGKNAKTEFEKLKEQIQNTTSETQAMNIAVTNFGSRGGTEMVKVLQASAKNAEKFSSALRDAGSAIEDTYNASRTTSDALQSFKNEMFAVFGGLGQGIADSFRDIVDTLTSIFEWIRPVIQPVFDLVGDLFSFIGSYLQQVIGFIIEFEKRYVGITNSVGKSLKNMQKSIKSILDNIIKMFRNQMGFIFALLDGKWALAWEYAKNTTFRVIDSLFGLFSTYINNFSNLINMMIDKLNWFLQKYNQMAKSKVGEFFGLPTAKEIEHITDVSLSEISGVTNLIEESEKRISELSSKTTSSIIDNSEEVVDSVTETTDEIESIVEDSNKDLIKDEKKVVNNFITIINNFGDKVKTTVTKIFSNVSNIIKKAFSISSNVFKFDTSDALDSLLEFEDAVLTFFTSGIQKIPGFLSSVMQSIDVLLKNVNSNLTVIDLTKLMFNSLTNLTNELPSIIMNLTEIIYKLFTGAVSSVSAWVQSGGWKTLLESLLYLQMMLEKTVVDNIDNIAEMIVNMLPTLVDVLIRSIVSASNTLSKIAPALGKIISEVLIQTIELAFNGDVIEASVETVDEAIKGIIIAVIENLPRILTTLIKSVFNSIFYVIKGILKRNIKSFIAIGSQIMSMIWDGISKKLPSFLKELPSIFLGGLKSVANAFITIGSWIAETIVNGMSSISSFFVGIVSDLWSGITGVTDNLFDMFSTPFENIKELVDWAFSGIKYVADNLVKWFTAPFLWMKEVVDSIFGGAKSVFGTIGSIFGFATGTNNAPSGLALVGENGPELIDFKGGERIYNADNTRRILTSGSSSANNFNITFNNIQDTSAYTMMKQLKQYNRNMALNGIL